MASPHHIPAPCGPIGRRYVNGTGSMFQRERMVCIACWSRTNRP